MDSFISDAVFLESDDESNLSKSESHSANSSRISACNSSVDSSHRSEVSEVISESSDSDTSPIRKLALSPILAASQNEEETVENVWETMRSEPDVQNEISSVSEGESLHSIGSDSSEQNEIVSILDSSPIQKCRQTGKASKILESSDSEDDSLHSIRSDASGQKEISSILGTKIEAEEQKSDFKAVKAELNEHVEFLPDEGKENEQNAANIPKYENHLDEIKKAPSVNVKSEIDGTNVKSCLIVNQTQFNIQSDKVRDLTSKLETLKKSKNSVNLELLSDQGKRLIDRYKILTKLLKDEKYTLERMKVTQAGQQQPSTSGNAGTKGRASILVAPSWDKLQHDADLVQPATFGKHAIRTVDTQKALTMDGLRMLHGSIEQCPGEDVLASTPRDCVVELMPHQRRALAWMRWRETQTPSGGLLADDMGLGKTLTVISLCVSTLKETRDLQESREWKSKGGEPRPAAVLIVCPASVMGQWTREVMVRLRRRTLDVLEYHGTNRQHDARYLHRADIVLTTYATLGREHAANSAMFAVRWRRVVLDEAHQVRNFKTQGSVAACALKARSRWALTGTPIQNKELDMFGILKFLHCAPFDDIVVWKRWVSNKTAGGDQRLHTVMKSIMLRRTKQDLIESGAFEGFPERVHKTVEIKLDRDEAIVYSKMMVFSRTLFAQFLHQRAEKQGYNDPGKGKYDKMRRELLKLNKIGEVQQSQILVLLLRLRQVCIHPTLITKMLETTDIETNDDGDVNGQDDMFDLLDQINKLQIGDGALEDKPRSAEEIAEAAGAAGNEATLADAVKSTFRKDHSVFDPNRQSAKIRKCLDILKNDIIPTGDKAIIVSQWTSFLNLIAHHLKEERVSFCSMNGTVKVSDRPEVIDKLNNPKSSCKVMLLSLTAGGVGLNLVGANHLFIMDPHWNPQLELQAQDRIYRMGQKKTVNIYRLIASDSIEERIVALQIKKLEIAQAMLTGATIVDNKLSIDDLKMLFSM